MNAGVPDPAPTSPPEKPAADPVVIPATTRREMLFAVACGVGIMGFLGYGFVVMSSRQGKASKNTLTGTVKAKRFTPAPEDQISFSRKEGVKSRHIAGEYVFDVYVKGEDRTFEVPVDGGTYEAVRVGESFTFIRPKSEQVH